MTEHEDTTPHIAHGEKLQKVLARLGLASRRDVENWIAAGRVKVYGSVATLGQRVDLHDAIPSMAACSSVKKRPKRSVAC